MKLRILKSAVTNPWFNLATEDWIFNTLDPDSHTLFLWRNSETVVIGRSQHPWVECKIDKMEADDVFLARRQSGGGAVHRCAFLGTKCVVAHGTFTAHGANSAATAWGLEGK